MDNDMRPLASTNLAAASYDEENRVLRIRFRDLGEYEYDNVPKDVAEGLFQAGSAGRYFASNIKGRYRYYKA